MSGRVYSRLFLPFALLILVEMAALAAMRVSFRDILFASLLSLTVRNCPDDYPGARKSRRGRRALSPLRIASLPEI